MHSEPHDDDPLPDVYARVEVDLSSVVAEGRTSEAEARTRLEEMRREISENRDRGNKRRDWGAIKRRIEGAVDRGDLTREEADAKYREIKKRISREDKNNEVVPDTPKRRIDDAVERRDVSREDADVRDGEPK